MIVCRAHGNAIPVGSPALGSEQELVQQEPVQQEPVQMHSQSSQSELRLNSQSGALYIYDYDRIIEVTISILTCRICLAATSPPNRQLSAALAKRAAPKCLLFMSGTTKGSTLWVLSDVTAT